MTDPNSPETEKVGLSKGGLIADARTMLDSYVARDPAALGRVHVMLCSTGLHAVMWHKMCHSIWNLRLRLFARMLSNVGNFLFGAEIHPQVKVGRRLFIDHGSSVVIGQTSEIGDDVSIYQGATLGGVTQTDRNKRHPTLGNGVIVGAGAKILGPITIGEKVRVGSNAVVLADVEAGKTVVGVPARATDSSASRGQFVAYGCGADSDERCRQVWAKDVESLMERIEKLESRIATGDGVGVPKKSASAPTASAGFSDGDGAQTG